MEDRNDCDCGSKPHSRKCKRHPEASDRCCAEPEANCIKCHRPMSVEFGDEPTAECHSCAHDLLEKARADIIILTEALKEIYDYTGPYAWEEYHSTHSTINDWAYKALKDTK